MNCTRYLFVDGGGGYHHSNIEHRTHVPWSLIRLLYFVWSLMKDCCPLLNFSWTPFNRIREFGGTSIAAMPNVHEIYYECVYQMTKYTHKKKPIYQRCPREIDANASIWNSSAHWTSEWIKKKLYSMTDIYVIGFDNGKKCQFKQQFCL